MTVMYNAKVSNILEGHKNQNKNSDFLTKKPNLWHSLSWAEEHNSPPIRLKQYCGHFCHLGSQNNYDGVNLLLLLAKQQQS